MKCLPVILPYVIPEISNDRSTFILNNQVVQNFSLEFFYSSGRRHYDPSRLENHSLRDAALRHIRTESSNIPLWEPQTLRDWEVSQSLFDSFNWRYNQLETVRIM
jgi:hypothetical protein